MDELLPTYWTEYFHRRMVTTINLQSIYTVYHSRKLIDVI